MNKLSFKEILNIDYKFIFEYFDTPLSFIGESKKRNYLFYYVDDETFFIAELKKIDINELNISKNLKCFMTYLLELEKVEILKFDFVKDEVSYQNIDDADFEVDNYLPTSEKIIDYDYNLELDIPYDFDYLKELNFPLETDNMTVRIADRFNSHVYSFEVIENVMIYVKKSFDAIKAASKSGGNIVNQELMMSPPTQGSFKMNFLVSEDNSMLDDGIDFYPILNIIDEVTVENRELNLEIIDEEVGVELIESINELYNVVKQEGVSIEFYENKDSKDRLARLSSNGLLDNNLKVFREKISDKDKLITKYSQMKIAETRFVTGSLIYNSVKIDIDGDTQKAKFELELFRKIKNKTQHLTLDQSISIDLTIETSEDIEGNIVKKVLIIDNFRYL